ncbi:nucleotidyltransferase domain-containing protein [Nocardia takedensis]
MNISGRDEFERTGSTMLEVRQVLRTIDGWFGIALDDFVRVFPPQVRNPGLLFERLVERGYLEETGGFVKVWNPETRSHRDSEAPLYGLTVRGGAFKNASAAKPVHRATADAALAKFLARVREVEANPMSLCVVERVILFGSMLDPDRDRVSDVDLAIAVVDNTKVRAAAGERTADSVFLTEMSGRRHASGYMGEVSVFKFLKNRSRVLSLTRIGAGGTIGGLPPETPHRIVYERA